MAFSYSGMWSQSPMEPYPWTPSQKLFGRADLSREIIRPCPNEIRSNNNYSCIFCEYQGEVLRSRKCMILRRDYSTIMLPPWRIKNVSAYQHLSTLTRFSMSCLINYVSLRLVFWFKAVGTYILQSGEQPFQKLLGDTLLMVSMLQWTNLLWPEHLSQQPLYTIR